MSSGKPINVGVIGLSARGWGAISHGPALAHPSIRPIFAVSAIQTSSEASAAAAKEIYVKKWPSLKAYHGPDSKAIAEDPDVDVVAITVKAPDHKAAVDSAVAAGKDFFVEYPPGKSLAESEEMRRMVKENGKIRVMVGLQGRLSATMRKIKKIIDSGKIGKILSTTSVANVPREAGGWQPEGREGSEYLLDKNNGATLLTIAGGHQLDTLIYLLGPFANVSGTASTQYPTVNVLSKEKKVIRTYDSNSHDHYAFSGTLVSGAHVSITWRSGYKSTPGRTQFLWIIDGEDGSIKFESDKAGSVSGSIICMWDPKTSVNGVPLDDYLTSEGIEYSDPELKLEEGEQGTFAATVKKEWIEFGKTLNGGKGEYADLDDAIEVLRVVDAVERSAVQGGVAVKLN